MPIRPLLIAIFASLLLLCAGCGSGDTGSGGDGGGGGFDNPTVKRYANGRYTLGSGTHQLEYWRFDDGDDRYELYRVVIAAPAIDVFGQGVSGSSTVTEIRNVTEGVIHDEVEDGTLDGYLVGSSVTITGRLQGYLWELNVAFALGETIQARYCPYDGEGTVDGLSGLLTAGSLTGPTWRDGDADQVGARYGAIPYSRSGNNVAIPSEVAAPLPNAAGDWYKDGGWIGELDAYLPAIGLDGVPLWSDYDQLSLDLDLDFTSGGDITGTADFLSLTEGSEAGAVDTVFEVDETFTVTGAVRGGMIALLIESDVDDWQMSVLITPNDILGADAAGIVDEAALGYGIAQPDAVWPAGECELDLTHDDAVLKISN